MITSLALIVLYWDAVTHREDGTPVEPNEVAYYEMFHNGQLYVSTPDLQVDVTDYGDYQVRAVGTDQQRSEMSNTVTYTKEKGKLNAPGQLRKNR